MPTTEQELLDIALEGLANNKPKVEALKKKVSTLSKNLDAHTNKYNKDKADLLDTINATKLNNQKDLASAIANLRTPKDGKDGKSVHLQDIIPIVDTHIGRIEKKVTDKVDKAVKSIPVVKDGKDGKDGLPGRNGIDGRNGKNGLDGKDGKDGKSVSKAQLESLISKYTKEKLKKQVEKNLPTFAASAVPSSPIITKQTVAKWMEESGGSTYTNNTPVPKALGGVLAGTTFNNVKVTEVLDMLLYPYMVPSFTSFSGISGPYEIGDTLPASTITMSWNTSNSTNVADGSIEIIDTTNNISLASSLVNDGSEDVTISDITYTTPSQHIFTIRAINTKGDTLSRVLKINWYSGVFYGESALEDLTENDIEALRVKVLKSNSSGIYDLLGGNYKWICYPTSMGLKTTFKDISTNFDVAMDDVKTVSVTNSFDVVQDYYCHRTYNELGGDISIAIS